MGRAYTVKKKCEYCDGRGYTLITPLAALREKVSLTQQEVADRLSYTRTSLSNIERGIQSPPIEKIMEMAVIYDVEPVEIFNAVLATKSPKPTKPEGE